MPEPTELEMGRLFQKVDTIIQNQERFLDQHEKLSSRLGSVESKLHWYTGSLAAISAAFLFLGDQIKRAMFGS